MQELSAGILTGGQAQRLQSLGPHTDKGLLLLQQKPLIAWTAQRLQPYVSGPLLISANRHLKAYAAYGEVHSDPDFLEAYQGPLAGLLALLKACPTDWLVVLPVDMPLLPKSLVMDLWQAHLQQPAAPAFYVHYGRDYPLCLLLRQNSVDSLADYLNTGQRRVRDWLHRLPAQVVQPQGYSAEHFLNINTPADLAAIESKMQAMD